MTGEFNIAVHALVFLSHTGESVSSEELSKNICTNPARVRKIMAKLKKAKLIATREGKKGGYKFELDPKKVTLDRVIEAIDTDPIEVSWRSGDHDMDCMVASGMADAMDKIYGHLNENCLSYLKTISIKQVEDSLQ